MNHRKMSSDILHRISLVRNGMKFAEERPKRRSYSFLKIYVVINIIGIACIGALKRDISLKLNLEQDDINKKLEFLDFCNSANIRVLTYPDIKMNTIVVSFEFSDPELKKCFAYFHICLENKYRKVKEYKVQNREKKISHIFENVSCGVYELTIQPFYNDWQPAPMIIRHPDVINMSSSDCNDNLPDTIQKIPVQNVEKEIIIGLVVASILIITVSGLVYYYCWSDKTKREDIPAERNRPEEHEIPRKNIHLYILYYCNRNDDVQRESRIMKDYLLNSSYFEHVADIEEELVLILFNVNNWVKSILEKEDNDGNIKKLILVDSRDDKDEEYELENMVFSEFIKKLTYTDRCLTDYDNLFVVTLDGVTTHSEELRDIVSRDRYNIHRDLEHLCHNLRSVC